MKFSSSSSGFLSIIVIAFTLLCCFMLLGIGSASAEDVSVVSDEFTFTTYSTPVSYNPSSTLVSLYNDALSDTNCNGHINSYRTRGNSLSTGTTHSLYIRDAFRVSVDFDYCGSKYYDGTSLTSSSGVPASSNGKYIYLDSYVYTDHVVTSDVVSNVLADYGSLPFTIVEYEYEDEYGYLGYAYVFFDSADILSSSSSTPFPSGSITYSVAVTQDSDTGRYTLNIGKSDSTSSYYYSLLRQIYSTDGSVVEQEGIFYTQSGITSATQTLSSCVPHGTYGGSVYLESDYRRTQNFETEYYKYTLALYDTVTQNLIGSVAWGSAFNPYVPVTPSAFDFEVTPDIPSQTYTVDLERNGNVMHLAITGKIFGWMSVYTYYEDRPTFDLTSDSHVTGLPIYWLGLGVDYEAQVFGEGGAYTGDNWRYSWNQDNYGLTPGVPSATPTPYQVPTVTFTSIMPHPTAIGTATSTPRVPAIGDPYYDTWTIFSVPGFNDEDYFSFDDFINALKSASLPGSLIEYFDVETPEEYKERTSVSPESMFYNFQQSGFSLFESVLYLPCGALYIITSIIAYLPETVYGFFSELVVFMTASFASFNSFVVIPSMILEKVVTLVPTPVMNLALLLFAVDLFFLFFRLVVPGIISGSKALGAIWNTKKGDK